MRLVFLWFFISAKTRLRLKLFVYSFNISDVCFQIYIKLRWLTPIGRVARSTIMPYLSCSSAKILFRESLRFLPVSKSASSFWKNSIIPAVVCICGIYLLFIRYFCANLYYIVLYCRYQVLKVNYAYGRSKFLRLSTEPHRKRRHIIRHRRRICCVSKVGLKLTVSMHI